MSKKFLIQFQVAVLDPALFAEPGAQHAADHGGQHKADEDQPHPVKGGDGRLGAAGHIGHPAGVDTDLTQTQMGKILSCSQRVYSNYERGELDIPTEILCKLARYYGVTTDYLLNLSDVMWPYGEEKDP